jgi:hypothetical protein
MQDAYYHIHIKPEDKHKTGIITPIVSYQYERLAFGLAGAPSTFSKVMDKVLLRLGSVICLIFMDDILVFTKDIDEHADRLRQVFERSQIHFKFSKVSFCGEECRVPGIYGNLRGSETE